MPRDLKNVDIPDTEQGINFLIVGKHGSLTDTMIYAHVDLVNQRVTLISIPRDLEVNNRKLNAVYSLFGIEELKRQLTKLTGYRIDKYILIDMYAFIDVIDIIGGVDLTLDKAVIDPSYKVFEEGKWSTLYYKPGNYHLNGRQALRLARSRHYSSDFERAKRQHLILDALKQKALSMGVGEADKIVKIAQTVLSHTETDITPQDALTYFFRYKDFPVRKNNVLSTENVLTSKHKNEGAKQAALASCTNIVEESGKNKCLIEAKKIDDGAYILLPSGGNWNVIKYYFKTTFSQ